MHVRPRRVAFWGVSGIMFACVLVGVFGCSTTIRCPASVANPTPVFVLDHGRTASLVVPTADGNLVRYGYGDWHYYALGQNSLPRGIAALFWPTRATLGRWTIPGPATEQNIREQLDTGIDTVYELRAERSEVMALRDRLDGMYRRHAETLVVNRPYEFNFVHHPESYHAFHNSNTVLAGWLEELGMEARGAAMYSKWEVECGDGGNR